MTPFLIEALGWAATAVFVGSYFSSRAEVLVRVQMLGAIMWVGYGALMRAPPVVVANVLVLAAAAWKAWQVRRPIASEGDGGPATPANQGPPGAPI
ncbi:MAG: hypothetical protein HZB56_12900 [Deltaproteobacteria bacterium]|nr:hypothetical protein [Deltaproteobacteria bacterium]